jgi:hypothetical protein
MEWVRFTEVEEVSRWRGGVFLGGVGGFSLRKEPDREGLVLMGGGFCEGGIGWEHLKPWKFSGETYQLSGVQEFHELRKHKIVILSGGGRVRECCLVIESSRFLRGHCGRAHQPIVH